MSAAARPDTGPTPPRDTEAEELVLAGMWCFDDYADIGLAELTPEHFTDHLNRLVFEAMRRLADRGEPVAKNDKGIAEEIIRYEKLSGNEAAITRERAGHVFAKINPVGFDAALNAVKHVHDDRVKLEAISRLQEAVARKDTSAQAAAIDTLTLAGDSTWQTPLPLEEVVNLPEYPIDALPAVAADFCWALSHALQTPPALAGGLILIAIATAAQRHFQIEIKPGWIEPLCIWTMTALPPANRKSPVLNFVFAVVTEFERAEAIRLAPEIATAAAQKKVLELKLKRTTEAAANGQPGDNVDAIAQELAMFKVPAAPRLTVEDVTTEKAVELLAANQECLTVASAEGAAINNWGGRYTDGIPAIEIWLAGHAADRIAVDRIGRGTTVIHYPRISVGLAVQPCVLNDLVKRTEFKNRGLCGRFLFALPNSYLGNRDLDAPPVPHEISAAWMRRMGILLNIRAAVNDDGTPAPLRTIRLSAEARALLRDFEGEIETGLGHKGKYADYGDWAGKLAGATGRIAGLLHVLQWSDDAANIPLSAETMTAAIRIARFYEAHALHVLGGGAGAGAQTPACRLLSWIEKGKRRSFTYRACLTNAHLKQKDGERDEALDVLLVKKWIRERTPPVRGEKRNGADVFEVNPQIWLESGA